MPYEKTPSVPALESGSAFRLQSHLFGLPARDPSLARRDSPGSPLESAQYSRVDTGVSCGRPLKSVGGASYEFGPIGSHVSQSLGRSGGRPHPHPVRRALLP